MNAFEITSRWLNQWRTTKRRIARVIRLAIFASDDVIAAGVRGRKGPLSSSLRAITRIGGAIKQFVGSDVAEKENSVCLVNEVGQILFEEKVDSDPGMLTRAASQACACGAHRI
jgi:hypothetical protein